jgi:heme oxygenase
MLSEALKAYTKQPHQELERVIIHHIKQLESKADYVNLLKIFYGFIKPVEQRLAAKIDQQIVSDMDQRRKTDWILQDISFLDGRHSSLAFADDLPQLNTVEEALGAMYVLEGSTLGGKFISKMISEKLDISLNEGFTFFNGYKEHTGLMWTRFKEVLNNYLGDESTTNSVAEAANQTFIKFKKWFNEY